MPSGSCLCGDIAVSYDAEPKGKSLCHCVDCRKITGSTFSTNLLIPEDNLKVTQGTPHQYSKTADSGNKMTSFLCSNCGTTLWRETKMFPGVKILKAGVVEGDDALNDTLPQVELFASRRVGWLHEIPDATQLKLGRP